MGSFNVKCGLTGKEIIPGAQAVGFMFVPQHDSKKSCKDIFGTDIVVSNDGPNYLFRLETLPLELSYEDYGHFKVLNCSDPCLRAYFKVKGIKLDEDDYIDACGHNLFVVSKTAYDSALSSRNYMKNAKGTLNIIKKFGKNLNLHLKDRGDTPLAGMFLDEGEWSDPGVTFHPKIHKAYKAFYLSDPKAFEKKLLEILALNYAMWDVGRFYHKIIAGSQDSNTKSLKYLYTETFKV